jgi:hypothetical protein
VQAATPTSTPTPTAIATQSSIGATSTPTSTPTPGSGSGVTLLSTTLNFGTVILGQNSDPSVVTLTNGSASKLTIKSTSVGFDFEIMSTTCGSSLGAGQSCTYAIEFRPLTTGTKSELFKVNDSSPDSPQEVHLQGICKN